LVKTQPSVHSFHGARLPRQRHITRPWLPIEIGKRLAEHATSRKLILAAGCVHTYAPHFLRDEPCIPALSDIYFPRNTSQRRGDLCKSTLRLVSWEYSFPRSRLARPSMDR